MFPLTFGVIPFLRAPVVPIVELIIRIVFGS